MGNEEKRYIENEEQKHIDFAFRTNTFDMAFLLLSEDLEYFDSQMLLPKDYCNHDYWNCRNHDYWNCRIRIMRKNIEEKYRRFI